MRRLALIVLAAVALPGVVAAQSYGQPYYGGPAPTTYGQSYGGYGQSYGHGSHGQSYGQSHGQNYGQSHGYGYSTGYGDPRAYRPPVQYGHGYDRGGRYGYSTGQWTRWSSPPGRGYHDVYGYNDDRAPRGSDHGRSRDRDCYCGVGAYLYDR